MVLVEASATRTVIDFIEKCVGEPEAFAFLLPSGELVAVRFEGELSFAVDGSEWRASPFRVVEET